MTKPITKPIKRRQMVLGQTKFLIQKKKMDLYLMPTYRNYFEIKQYLSEQYLIEENIEHLYDLGVSKNFLKPNHTKLNHKKETYTFYLIKIDNFWSLKDDIKRIRRQATE